ncbi:ribonucleotide reductase N-terminal alpha domain-containing protein [Trinickia sp. NRRL B-1857]|uniref:ribonucleotide reductase N-terminal alpha domain-containing protein n=1 Tax=Trinickia sp. NRRL B-1857 TaxID=3162879 RepID=UPI003D275BD1
MQSQHEGTILSAQDVSLLIWSSKYRIRDAHGYAEASLEETFARVANALSMNEVPHLRQAWSRAFLRCMSTFEFLPAGRVLRNAGRAGAGTMVSTFAMPALTTHNWLGTAKTALRTMVSGGGIGLNFQGDAYARADRGRLRRDLEFWQSIATKAMASPEGRAAMIGLIPADHPEIREFINAKSRIGDLSQFNLSVLVSHDILEREDELIRAICESIVDTGEPGVLFIDNIAVSDNLRTIEKIVGTNSCCEQPLPAFGSSPLGSVNVARFVDSPFTLEARIDFDRLDAVVCTAIRMLDNIIELERYPTERQTSVARSTRRVGLGIMGLDDALRMLGMEYGSEDSLDTVAALLRRVRAASYAASIELAAERGAFPRFGASQFTTGPGWLGVEDSGACGLFFRRGIRNGALTAIAPAGSLALLAGNVSAGIEPTYSRQQTRTIRIDGVPQTFRLQPCWAGQAPSYLDRSPSGGYATDISASAHVRVVGQAQRYVDGGISKTVNLGEHASAQDVRAAIHLGHALGVKGLSFYREHCRRLPVLV